MLRRAAFMREKSIMPLIYTALADPMYLPQQEDGKRGKDAGGRKNEAQEPVCASPGEQRDGGDDEADFEEGLGKVVAVAAYLGFLEGLLERFGLFLIFFKVAVPLLLMVGVGLEL